MFTVDVKQQHNNNNKSYTYVYVVGHPDDHIRKGILICTFGVVPLLPGILLLLKVVIIINLGQRQKSA